MRPGQTAQLAGMAELCIQDHAGGIGGSGPDVRQATAREIRCTAPWRSGTASVSTRFIAVFGITQSGPERDEYVA